MVTFIGEYTAKIDDKGRIVFPSAFKGVMPEGGDMRFVIKKDLFAPCLEMYTFEEWENQSREVKDRLNFFNKEHAIFWREYTRNRDVVEPDAKLGRMLTAHQKETVILRNPDMPRPFAVAGNESLFGNRSVCGDGIHCQRVHAAIRGVQRGGTGGICQRRAVGNAGEAVRNGGTAL